MAREIQALRLFRWVVLLALFAFISACASSRPTRSAYSRHRPSAEQLGNYRVPGPPDDPWGPYIRQAATRFQFPERWIREVMRRESEGELYQGGSLTTSAVGAMGLMQVMPGTYLMLQQRYSLGIDPYDPHDNVMAGTAYLREMYDRFGSPGFLAAYNAGPERLNEFLSGGTPLPAETVAYVAAIAPRLGASVAASGPLAFYAVANPETNADDLNRQAAEGSFQPVPHITAPTALSPPATIAQAEEPAAETASDDSIAQILNSSEASRSGSSHADADEQSIDDLNRRSLAEAPVGVSATTSQPLSTELPAAPRDWAIQVGAFSTPLNAQAAMSQARSLGGSVLADAVPAMGLIVRGDGATLYRAKLAGLSAEAASAACERLLEARRACIVIPASAES